MATGPVIDTDQTIHSALKGLFRPFPVSRIMVNGHARGPGPVDHPARIAQGGYKKRNLLFQRDLHPLMHPLQIFLRAPLDDQIHPDRFPGKTADSAQPFTKAIAVYIGQTQGLHNPDTSGLGHRRDQLRIRAGVHGAADQRDINTQCTAEISLCFHSRVLFQARSTSALSPARPDRLSCP